MKKNFKRNRILLTSLIGLAVLGSATAAFSTWIFGIQKKSAELGDITVEVDAVKDDTAYLDIKVDSTDNKIRLAETESISAEGNAVNNENAFTTETQGDFEIKLSTFSFAISNEYAFNSVDFTFSVLQTGSTTDINSVTAGEKDNFGRTNGSNYKYIDLVKANLDINDFRKDESTGLTEEYSLYTANTKSINFKWGNFFETHSPAEFYNGKYNPTYADKDLKEKLLFIQNAKTELKTMKEAFTGAKIKITATLNVTKTK